MNRKNTRKNTLLGLIMALLSVLCLAWGLLNLHPSSAPQSAGTKSVNTVAQLDAFVRRMNSARSDIAPEHRRSDTG